MGSKLLQVYRTVLGQLIVLTYHGKSALLRSSLSIATTKGLRILFALSTADRRFIYADVGNPGVLGDSTLFERSHLKSVLTTGEWCGETVPSLYIDGIEVRPYVISDCAFSLPKHVMKTSSKDELRANNELAEWDRGAATTRKPVECTFGILKNRFSTLSSGINMHHADDAVYFITACVILHNLCIARGDDGNAFLTNEDEDVVVNTDVTSEGKRVRYALLSFARLNG